MTPAPAEFNRPATPTQSGDLTPFLRRLLVGETLDSDEAAAAFERIMTGSVHHGEIGAFLALLATRVPTTEELLGAARVMRAHVERVPTACDPERIIDTAGTGGAPKTFNVSTAAAIVAAAAGGSPSIAVAKHGNRSRTGRGSAEVLQCLGVNVDADRATQARCLAEARICFCFAIHHHPAARHAMPVRLALGFPTIFNLLGPLTNPAGARRQLMGVYEKRFLQPIAETLATLGAVRAMVVHSDDGLDELSINAPTTAVHVNNGRTHTERIVPGDLGLEAADFDTLVATDLKQATEMVGGVIDGSLTGPPRDMTLLNASATLLVADKVDSLSEGLKLAAQTIDSGQAAETLKKLIDVSNT